ncbi:MAG: DUF308 domain-containing protein [Bacteroidales bacterium]|nr:DUF308 domain-containing protein [Bacteroidales bacterium]
MNRMINRGWGWEVLKGLIALALAVMIFLNPADALVAIATYLGALAIIMGLVIIIMSLYKKSGFWQLFFGQGIIYALIGLLIIIYPELSASLLIFLIGLFITILGIIQLSSWLRLREVMPARSLLLLTAVISILVGVTLLFNPFEGAVLATIIMGIYAVLYASTRFYTAYAMAKT